MILIPELLISFAFIKALLFISQVTMATSDMGDSQTSASSASGATIDWAAVFQSPEFLSGLQTAIAGVTTSTQRLEQLEQLGDSIPSHHLHQPSPLQVTYPWLKVGFMLLLL